MQSHECQPREVISVASQLAVVRFICMYVNMYVVAASHEKESMIKISHFQRNKENRHLVFVCNVVQ